MPQKGYVGVAYRGLCDNADLNHGCGVISKTGEIVQELTHVSIVIDAKRGKKVAGLLYNSFTTKGIHGRMDMPEDVVPSGVVRGNLKLRLGELFQYIREAWFQSVKDLKVRSRPMIALDVDEPLWHLSKYGCTNRDKATGYCAVYRRCEARDFCVNGRVNIENDTVELQT